MLKFRMCKRMSKVAQGLRNTNWCWFWFKSCSLRVLGLSVGLHLVVDLELKNVCLDLSIGLHLVKDLGLHLGKEQGLGLSLGFGLLLSGAWVFYF